MTTQQSVLIGSAQVFEEVIVLIDSAW